MNFLLLLLVTEGQTESFLSWNDDTFVGIDAMIIMGRSANGLTEWKLKSGKTLQEFESGEIK